MDWAENNSQSMMAKLNLLAKKLEICILKQMIVIYNEKGWNSVLAEQFLRHLDINFGIFLPFTFFARFLVRRRARNALL